MRPLSKERILQKRLNDYRSMEASFSKSKSSIVTSWKAYANESDRRRGCETTDGERARVYVIELSFRSLKNVDQYHDRWTLLVDLSHSRYPDQISWPAIISSPKPWVPRISHCSGNVCHGDEWRRNVSLAAFVVKVLRFLNFDEVDRGDNGLNPEARSFWRTSLKCKPLDPDIKYPETRLRVEQPPTPPSLFGSITTIS